MALGRVGIPESPGGRRLHELKPDRDLVEGHRDDRAALVREADAVVAMVSPVTDVELEGSSARIVRCPPARPSHR